MFKKYNKIKICIFFFLIIIIAIFLFAISNKIAKAGEWDNAQTFAENHSDEIAYNENDGYIYYGSSATLADVNSIRFHTIGHVIKIQGTDKWIKVKEDGTEKLVSRTTTGSGSVGDTEYLLFKMSYNDLIALFSQRYGEDDVDIQSLYSSSETIFVIDSIMTIKQNNIDKAYIWENGNGDIGCNSWSWLAMDLSSMEDLWYNTTKLDRDYSDYYNKTIPIVNKKIITTEPIHIIPVQSADTQNNASIIYTNGDKNYVSLGKYFRITYNTSSTSSNIQPNRAYFNIKEEAGWRQAIWDTYIDLDKNVTQFGTLYQNRPFQDAYAFIANAGSVRSNNNQLMISSLEYSMNRDGLGLKFYPYSTVMYGNTVLTNSGDKWDDSKACYVICDGLAPTINNISDTYGWSKSNITLFPQVTDSGSGVKTITVLENGSSASSTITSEGIHNLSVNAVDNVGNSSSKNTKVMIDKTPPNISINGTTNSNPTYGWTKEDVLLNINANDSYSGVKSLNVAIKNTDGSYSTVLNNMDGSNISLSCVDEGSFVYRVIATDNLDQSRIQYVTVKIDKTPPDIIINGIKNSDVTLGWTNNDIKITASFNENLSGIQHVSIADSNGNIVKELTYSNEQTWITNMQKNYIVKSYESIFKYTPNQSEIDFWYNYTISNRDIGYTPVGLILDQHFTNTMTNAFTDNDYVYLLYNLILNRNPDPGGYEAYMSFINGGQNRFQAALNMYNSEEGVGRRSLNHGVPTNEVYTPNPNTAVLEYTVSTDGSFDWIVTASDGSGNERKQTITTMLNKAGLKVGMADHDWTNQDVLLTGYVNNSQSIATNGYIFKYDRNTNTRATNFIKNWLQAGNGIGTYTLDKNLYQGVTSWMLYASDVSGNSATTISDVKIDITPPTISGISDNYNWTNKSFTVNATMSDSLSGVKKIELWNNNTEKLERTIINEESEIHSTNFSFLFDKEGSTDYTINVWDYAGNVTSMDFTTLIDYTKPIINDIVNNDWTNTSVTINTILKDASNGLGVILPSGIKQIELYDDTLKSVVKTINDPQQSFSNVSITNISYTTLYSETFTTEQLHTYILKVTDRAGNISQKSFIVKIDKTNPLIENIDVNSIAKWTNKDVIILPTTRDLLSKIKSFTLSSSNSPTNIIQSGQVSLDGSSSLIYTFTKEQSLQYILKATDNANNYSTKSFYINIDKTLPNIENLQDNYTSTNQKINISIITNDALSGVKQSVLYDSNNIAIMGSTGNYPLNYSFDDETYNGSYHIITTDNAGNQRTKYFNVFINKVPISTITFDLNGGTLWDWGNGEYRTGTFLSTNNAGVSSNAYTNPTKNGYDFAGWEKSNLLELLVPFGTVTYNYLIDSEFYFVFPTYNVTLTAKWTPKPASLIVDLNGGSMKRDDGKVFLGDNITLQNSSLYDNSLDYYNPTKDGFTFVGWETIPSNIQIFDTDSANIYDYRIHNEFYVYLSETTVHLKAKWIESNASYTVNYYLMNTDGATYTLQESSVLNGAVGSKVTGVLKDYGAGFEKPTEEASITITNDGKAKIDYYYKRLKFSLTIDANGGLYQGNSKLVLTEYYGVSITIDLPIRSGYEFQNWAFSGGGSVNDNIYTFGTSNGLLTAQWKGIVYYIEYHSNGGSGIMPQSKVNYDESFMLSDCKFTKDGYSFAGWNTIEDGSGTSYSNKETIKNLTNINDAKILLYAQWNKNTSNVSNYKFITVFINNKTNTNLSGVSSYGLNVINTYKNKTNASDGLIQWKFSRDNISKMNTDFSNNDLNYIINNFSSYYENMYTR